jgi:hypothetical protein
MRCLLAPFLSVANPCGESDVKTDYGPVDSAEHAVSLTRFLKEAVDDSARPN